MTASQAVAGVDGDAEPAELPGNDNLLRSRDAQSADAGHAAAVGGLELGDRRRAEIVQQNLVSVLDASDDAITTCSLDGVFLTWNRGAEMLYGYTADEAVGQPLDLIIPSGQRATDHLNWERLLNDEPVRSLEAVRVTKDGQTVVVSVTRTLVVDQRLGVVGVASVGRDITHQTRAQSLLAEAHAQAVAASELKSQFLANMSHEIRTPMNGVIGMNELLLRTELTEEQRFYAEHVASSGEQMMAIINDILDVSKIEAGELELDVRDFALHETLEQACVPPRLQARAKGLELELQIAAEVPRHARGDDRRLRQVLANLLANAVKFTSDGSIVVRATASPRPANEHSVRVEISDTGIGIDPHTVDRCSSRSPRPTRRPRAATEAPARASRSPANSSTSWAELSGRQATPATAAHSGSN